MHSYASRTFWLGVAERGVKTAAQTAVASIGTATLIHTVALAVVMSVLTSLADPDRTDVAITTGGHHTASE